jgi:hypothetical protein
MITSRSVTVACGVGVASARLGWVLKTCLVPV